jgi:hypothetical protein
MRTVVFVSSPVSHCSVLIKLGLALIVRRFQNGTSFLVLLMAEATGSLCIFYTQLFTIPSIIVMVFAATQTYRDLTIYGSNTTNMTTYDTLPLSMLTVL